MNVGIDLGTTYSTVACFDKDKGAPVVLRNCEGELSTPSAVFIGGGEVIAGAFAICEGGLQPENLIMCFKNYIGDPLYTYYIDGEDYTSEDISALYLAELKKNIEQANGIKIDGAVITCPAYFGSLALNSVRLAAEKAGINVLRILPEPAAAILACGFTDGKKKNVMVYDLGGTFDATVAEVSGSDISDIKIITTGGDHLLGGRDWDAKLTKYVIREFCNRTGDDPDEMACDPECIGYFSEYSEKTKKLLTIKESAVMTVRFNDSKEKIEVTRGQFEEETEDLLSRTVKIIDDLLTDRGMSMANDIDEIILVGGSTCMPQVKKRLELEYGKTVSYGPDSAVAMGAALMANRVG